MLAKQLPGTLSSTDVLDEGQLLYLELSWYLEEEGRVARANAEREAAEARSASRRGGLFRRRS